MKTAVLFLTLGVLALVTGCFPSTSSMIMTPTPTLRRWRAFSKKPTSRGETLVFLIRNKEAVAGLAFADAIRPESWQAVRR